jgi:hypothetical protein
MQQSRPVIPAQFNSRQVAFRFVFRLALLTAFASLGSQGFVVTLATLLALSAIFCSVAGTFRREALLGPELTHWDEAAMCAAIGYMLGALA